MLKLSLGLVFYTAEIHVLRSFYKFVFYFYKFSEL